MKLIILRICTGHMETLLHTYVKLSHPVQIDKSITEITKTLKALKNTEKITGYVILGVDDLYLI